MATKLRLVESCRGNGPRGAQQEACTMEQNCGQISAARSPQGGLRQCSLLGEGWSSPHVLGWKCKQWWKLSSKTTTGWLSLLKRWDQKSFGSCIVQDLGISAFTWWEVLGIESKPKPQNSLMFLSYMPYTCCLEVIANKIFNAPALWLWPIAWGRAWNFPLVASGGYSESFGFYRVLDCRFLN